MTTGICRNAGCANARDAKPIERYPGPGEYCPECGDALEPLAPAAAAEATPAPAPAAAPAAPFGGLTALEALAQFDAGAAAAEQPAPAQRPRKRVALVAASVALAAVAAVALLRPTAAKPPVVSNAVHVCRSSLTERFAADVVRAYADKAGIAPARFETARGGSCDVRFSAQQVAKGGDVVGHDGIVVVVNPANPLTRLTEDDVRLVFSGAITDWAEFGEPPGRIVPIMPPTASDEARTLAHTLFAQGGAAAGVRRLASSADVVRAVVSPGGRGTIGLVAFSAAVPAKVVALAPFPAPSSLSIGDLRYALSVALTVESASHDGAAAGLAAFARSEDAQAIVLRDGFVPKRGI
ncbi:MAG TPA: substrate-binding domain-containing protein [Candidatus Elarobacter sp.]|nr:substrate-binding domain-containing protein [Candidatus Elarobacter sp.]